MAGGPWAAGGGLAGASASPTPRGTAASPRGARCGGQPLPSARGGAREGAAGADGRPSTRGLEREDQFQILGAALQQLGEQVRALEGRQAAIGVRLVDVDTQLQGITEEQDTQSRHLSQYGGRLTAQEKGQKAVALGLQRALSATMARQKEQTSYAARLDELSAVRGGGAACGAGGGHGTDADVARLRADWAQCFDEQERRVTALIDTIAAHASVQQRDGQRLSAISDIVESQAQAVAQLQDSFCMQRLDEQEHRLAALGDAVAVLALEVTKATERQAPAEAEAPAPAVVEEWPWGAGGGGGCPTCACADDVAQLATRLSEQAEAVCDVQDLIRELHVGKSSAQHPRLHRRSGGQEATEMEASGAPEPEPEGSAGGDAARQTPHHQDWTVAAQNLEAQVGCSLAEVRRRMDALQELIDDRVLVQLWQVGQQLPETLGRLDRLAGQCQECLSKAEAHEVRLDLTRASFETQEQRLQALASRVERCLAGEPASARRGCSGCGSGEAALASAEALAGRVEVQGRALQELRNELRSCSAKACPQERSPPRVAFPDARGLAELAELAEMAGRPS